MHWIDTQEIADSLNEKKPDVNPKFINFVDLKNWVIELEEFEDNPERSGERLLEQIQQQWIDDWQ